MPIPQNEQEIVQALPSLSRMAEQHPPPEDPQQVYDVVVLSNVRYTRDAVEGALKELSDDAFIDLARCEVSVHTYEMPHQGASGGWVAFNMHVVRYGLPERFHQLLPHEA